MPKFIALRIALLRYWGHVLIFGVGLYISRRHASPLKEHTTAEMGRAVRRRIVVAQALYGFSALLCVVNTHT